MANKFENHCYKNTKYVDRSSYLCIWRVGTGWMGATMGARLFNMVLIFKLCDYNNYPEN